MTQISKHLIAIGCIALQVVVCLILLPQFKYCLEADLFSYVSIAEKYASGDLYHAINPYWSPFFSWIMVPLVLLGLPVYLVFKYLFVVFGAGVIWQFHKLLLEQKVPPIVRLAGTASVAVFSIYFSVYYSMPDIIVVYFYLLYFRWHKELFEDRRTAIVTGLIAGCCFFIKAYSLPFFLLYSVVMILVKWLIDKDLTRINIKHFGIYLLTMILVSSCWILPLSIKYGGPTIGSSGAFNYHMKMSDPYTKQLGYPYEDQLLPPPNPTAISYWEDPSKVNATLKQASKATLGNQLFITIQNIFVMGKTVQYYNPLFFLIAIVMGILLLRAVVESALVFKRELITATLFAGVYPSGYLLLFINERYQWVLFIFVLYISTLLFAKIVDRLSLKKWEQGIAAIGFFLLTAYAPTDRTQVAYRRLAPPQKADHAKALEIKEFIPANTRIAYDRYWGKGLVTAFVNDNQFYGVFAQHESHEELLAEIKRYDIEYVILYTDESRTQLAPYIELISPDGFSPGIFKMK